MKLFKALALLIGLAAPVAAGPYYELVMSTPTGKATQSVSGYIKVAASSSTYTVFPITIDGTNGRVTATVFAGSGALLTDIPQAAITDLSSRFDAIALSTNTIDGDLGDEITARGTGDYNIGIDTAALQASKVNRAGDTMTGQLTITSTLTVTGVDGSQDSIAIPNGWLKFGTATRGIHWQDGTTSTSAYSMGGGGSGTGHIISSGTDIGGYEQLPQRSTIAFDSSFFFTADSPTINSTYIGLRSCDGVPQEIPGGVTDGVNDEFYLVRDPKINSESVYVNGLLYLKGALYDYTIDRSTITFNAGSEPPFGSTVTVSYCYPTTAPDLNWSPPLKLSGTQIQDSTIGTLQMEVGLKNPIQSEVDGGYKKITRIEYDPSTGEVRVTYEN